MTCFYCNRTWHKPKNYFQLVSYLDWWEDRPCRDGKAGGHGRGQQQH